MDYVLGDRNKEKFNETTLERLKLVVPKISEILFAFETLPHTVINEGFGKPKMVSNDGSMTANFDRFEELVSFSFNIRSKDTFQNNILYQLDPTFERVYVSFTLKGLPTYSNITLHPNTDERTRLAEMIRDLEFDYKLR